MSRKLYRVDEYIPIDKELNDFAHYLENNDRCLLSARFGDGKTVFLSEFKRKYKDKYQFITIYPIDYQVSENRDIFEYIKRDILKELSISGDVNLDIKRFSTLLKLQGFMMNHPLEALKHGTKILQGLVPLSKKIIDIEKVLTGIDGLYEKYNEYANDIEENIINKYLNTFEKSIGSIYEFDAISQIICETISSLENESVLIIEDLDRIDPGHIFRILNVLSAHIDRDISSAGNESSTSLNNKFNFDKIILVCDYENIKHIYQHVYGERADFNGYIGKFSKVNPFKYSLRDSMKSYIIDNLHDLLKPYPNVCKVLSDLILDRYDNWANKSSLRFINTRLRKTLIKNTNIQTPSGCFDSLNSFTVLLELLKRFDISFDDFKNEPMMLAEPAISEFYGLAGIFLLDKELKRNHRAVFRDNINNSQKHTQSQYTLSLYIKDGLLYVISKNNNSVEKSLVYSKKDIGSGSIRFEASLNEDDRLPPIPDQEITLDSDGIRTYGLHSFISEIIDLAYEDAVKYLPN